MNDERRRLLEEAAELEDKAEAIEKQATVRAEKSKGKSPEEREALRLEAEKLLERSREQKRLAIEARANAKSLKTVEDYEKYLSEKAEAEERKAAKLAAEKAKELAFSRYDGYSEEKDVPKFSREALPQKTEDIQPTAEVRTDAYDAVLLKKLSSRERKALVREERAQLLAAATELKTEAKLKAQKAKAERKAANAAEPKAAESATAMADVLEARSAEQKRLAKENEKQAKVLKSVENYEKHLAKKQILAPITEKALGGEDALEEAVLAEEIAEAKKLSRRGHPGDPVRQDNPAKAEIQSCSNESRQEHEPAEFQHFLLVLLFFLRVQAFFQQFRVFEEHHDAGQEHRHKQDNHQPPSLRPGKRSRRNKQQCADQYGAGQKLDNC